MSPNPSLLRIGFVAGLFLFALSLQASVISVYVSGPDDQATFLPGAVTETFNDLTPGKRTTAFSSAIGTYQLNQNSAYQVQSADQYGGASGTNYVAFGTQSQTAGAITLDLQNRSTYFGFWYSAGDRQNGVSFYDGSSLLARLDTSDILQKLSGPTVTAVNGTVYQSQSYFGNPNNRSQDRGEFFAYVNVFSNTGGFTRVVFDNSGSTGTGFETDNHSIYSGAVILPGNVVAVPLVNSTQTPEPASAALFLLGGFALMAIGRYRPRARK